MNFSAATSAPSGSAPRKRPTALLLSSAMRRSFGAINASSSRCAGSDSWNSSMRMVVKALRRVARSSGLFFKCAIAALINSDGSMRTFASPAPVAARSITPSYRCQKSAAAGQYFSPSCPPRVANSLGEIFRSFARIIRSRSSRIKPRVRSGLPNLPSPSRNSGGHCLYPSVTSPCSKSAIIFSCSAPDNKIGSRKSSPLFIFRIEKASE